MSRFAEKVALVSGARSGIGRATAERLAADADGRDQSLVRSAYALALSRVPSEEELALAVEFIDQACAEQDSQEDRGEAHARFCQALLASAEFRYVD